MDLMDACLGWHDEANVLFSTTATTTTVNTTTERPVRKRRQAHQYSNSAAVVPPPKPYYPPQPAPAVRSCLQPVLPASPSIGCLEKKLGNYPSAQRKISVCHPSPFAVAGGRGNPKASRAAGPPNRHTTLQSSPHRRLPCWLVVSDRLFGGPIGKSHHPHAQLFPVVPLFSPVALARGPCLTGASWSLSRCQQLGAGRNREHSPVSWLCLCTRRWHSRSVSAQSPLNDGLTRYSACHPSDARYSGMTFALAIRQHSCGRPATARLMQCA